MNESIHGERTASELQDRLTELIEHQTAIFGSAARHCELAARLAAHLRRHPRQRHTSLSSRHSSLWVRSILDAYHKAKTQRPHTKSRHGSSFSAIKMQRLQTDCLRRTRAVHIAFAMRDLFFILFQQARAVLFETAQWPRFTGWLTS